MGRMEFIADERVVPPVTTRQSGAQRAAGTGLTATLFWVKTSMFLKRCNRNMKYFPFHTISLALG